MKRFILAMFLVVGSLAVFSATGNAQVTRQYSAKIPFDFSVGEKQYKAGDYTIGPVGLLTNTGFLVLTDRSTGKVHLIGQITVGYDYRQLTGKLNFVQSGDAWVLSSVETGTFSAELSGGHRGQTKIASNRSTSESKSVAVQ